jgi:hypothetical protein
MFGGGDKDMKTRNWKLAPVLGALILALFSIPGALAQCGMPTKAVKPASWNPQIGTGHLYTGGDDR